VILHHCTLWCCFHFVLQLLSCCSPVFFFENLSTFPFGCQLQFLSLDGSDEFVEFEGEGSVQELLEYLHNLSVLFDHLPVVIEPTVCKDRMAT